MKKMLILFSLLLVAFGFHFLTKEKNETIKVGVLAPMQHKAMDDIAAGFKEEMHKHFNKEVELHFENASGDKILLSAILNKFKRQKYDYIAAIGTETTLQALNAIPDHPIVGLDISQDFSKKSIANLASVFGPLDLPNVELMQGVIPGIKKFTLIFSTSDKNYKEAELIQEKAKKANLKAQLILVDTLADLYSLDQKIQRDSEAVFILKDHLCVSGAPTIAQVCEKLNIPFFSSDEGSVQAGALAALSNTEADVGRQGAILVRDMIRGTKVSEIQPQYIKRFTLFINKQKNEQAKGSLSSLEDYASSHNFNVQYLNAE